MARRDSIDDLLSPSLRISRPVAACSNCRKAKIKCDGRLPACTSCERSGKVETCSGSKDEYARGKERSYVAALEATATQLHKRVDDIQKFRAFRNGTSYYSSAASRFLAPGLGPAKGIAFPMSREEKKEAADIAHLVGDFGCLSVNATSRDLHDLSSTVSFAKMILAVSQLGELPPPDTKTLPARFEISEITRQYLDYDYVLLPFFSEAKFMSSVSAVYAEASRQPRPLDHWMVRMVLAIVAAKRSQQKYDAQYRAAQNHVAAALTYADHVLQPGSTSGVQAILFLLQYSLHDPDVFSSWHLKGFACRLVVDLGLHCVESGQQLNTDREAREMRQRVFYCVYALDRSISMAHERPFTFSDDSVSIDPPTRPIYDASSIASAPPGLLRSTEPSTHLFGIRRLQSRVHEETRFSSHETWTEDEATEFVNLNLSNISSWQLHASDPPQSHTNLFQSEALYSQISLLAPFSRVEPSNELYRALILEYAAEYAASIRPVIEDEAWQGSLVVTDMMRTDFVGRLFVDLLPGGPDQLLKDSIPRFPPIIHSIEEGADLPFPRSSKLPPSASGLSKVMRAVNCIESITLILGHGSQRFGTCCEKRHTGFQDYSAALLNELRSKRLELSAVTYTTGPPAPAQQSSPEAFIHQPAVSDQQTFLTQMPVVQPPYQFAPQIISRGPPPPALLHHISDPGSAEQHLLVGSMPSNSYNHYSAHSASNSGELSHGRGGRDVHGGSF